MTGMTGEGRQHAISDQTTHELAAAVPVAPPGGDKPGAKPLVRLDNSGIIGYNGD